MILAYIRDLLENDSDFHVFISNLVARLSKNPTEGSNIIITVTEQELLDDEIDSLRLTKAARAK
jgi:hypothetical protein